MSTYQPPLRDIHFVLAEVFDVERHWAATPGLADSLDMDTAQAILEEAGKVTAGIIAPLNRSGDEEDCAWNDGVVTTPSGFCAAYQTYTNGGWGGVCGSPEFGGMGMPKVIGAQVEEMVNSANLSFGLYPMLTAGACLSILHHASEALKAQYLPNMYAGRWAGSMCLTESHAGSDLGVIRTKAEPQHDGSYKVSGTKIFITGGEHDLTENIIHLVLAKLPDAPAGSKGISLFLVPKVMVNADGSLGERNAAFCGSIEHKMGIKASATCVMNFDGATGYLVGEVNKGLNAMFTMMNYERLGVGIQGLALGERSYQNAVTYARERIQGRASKNSVDKDKTFDPIIAHPDVRRMLLTMKALNEGGRAFSSYVALQLDIAKYSTDPAIAKRAERLVALLTPVAKAFLTDMGLETTVHGQQVFGGHGYIREWGQEQLIRDCRITQIYEGTNGIQALDLLGRKVLADGGNALNEFLSEIIMYTQEPGVEHAEALLDAVQQLEESSDWIRDQAEEDPHQVGAASVDYLHLFGYVAYAYAWSRMASVAKANQAADPDFYLAKQATARFFFKRILPRIEGLIACMRGGAHSLYDLADDQF